MPNIFGRPALPTYEGPDVKMLRKCPVCETKMLILMGTFWKCSEGHRTDVELIDDNPPIEGKTVKKSMREVSLPYKD